MSHPRSTLPAMGTPISYEDQLTTNATHAILGALGVTHQGVGTGGPRLAHPAANVIVDQRTLQAERGERWVYQTTITVEVTRWPAGPSPHVLCVLCGQEVGGENGAAGHTVKSGCLVHVVCPPVDGS